MNTTKAREKKTVQARHTRPGLAAQMRGWVYHHAQTFFASLGRLSRSPMSSLLTAGVIGIALAMPASLFVGLQNAHQLTAGWRGATQISAFLKPGLPAEQATTLARQWQNDPRVASLELVTPEQGLKEFRDLSGFGIALDALDTNPLPAALLIRMAPGQDDPVKVAALADELKQHDAIDQIVLDLKWVERLYAIMQIAQRGVLVVGGLLAIAVLLIIGNTIRLEIENRRDEIKIIKLIGATDSFIRRPFLYEGLWFGMLGGILASLLVDAGLWLLQGPAGRLVDLYGSSFTVHTLDPVTIILVIGCGALLGLSGAWLAVARHISDIEPG